MRRIRTPGQSPAPGARCRGPHPLRDGVVGRALPIGCGIGAAVLDTATALAQDALAMIRVAGKPCSGCGQELVFVIEGGLVGKAATARQERIGAFARGTLAHH